MPHNNFKLFCKIKTRDDFGSCCSEIEQEVNEWLEANDGNLTISQYELDIHEICSQSGRAQEFCIAITIFYYKRGE